MGLSVRHITEDFVNHVLYGDYLLDDKAIFKGEKMDETLVFSYTREMARYYESENISDEVKRRVLHNDFFALWINYINSSSDGDKYFLALGLKKLICSAADYGIIISDYDLKKMKDIEITGEGCLYDFISDYYKKNGLAPGTGDNISSGESWNEDDIKKALEKHEVFKSKNGTYIPYAMLYNPMSENHLINEHCSEALFCYCIDRADISMIMTESNKNVMKGFMKEISARYEDSDKYKEIAAKSFGVERSKLGAIGNAYAKYDKIFGEVLPRTDQRKKK